MADREIAASILESCRHGDRDAFRALYEAYKDKVYSICLYFFHGDAAEAADVTHEVFLKVFAGIAGFHGEANFSTWLYRLTQNACLDGARRRAARARTVEATERSLTTPLPNQLPTQYDDLTRAQEARTVQQAVSSLPPKFRLPILLRYFQDFSYEQMSAALNCSMGTVASRLNRGHKMLAKLLAAGGRDV